jgi:hypothetical protein
MRTAFSCLALAALLALTACAAPHAPRLGMVQDRKTGLQYGSIVEQDYFIDPSQFNNPKIKVNIRNTSGDPEFDLNFLRPMLEEAFAGKGYEPTQDDDFGILLDVNVVYSGSASENAALEYGLVGGYVGGVSAMKSSAPQAMPTNIASGVAIGSILGSYVTEDTYLIVANIGLAIKGEDIGTTKKFISFSGREKEEKKAFRNFRARAFNRVSVFAGGNNTPQSDIARGVRERFKRILADII